MAWNSTIFQIKAPVARFAVCGGARPDSQEIGDEARLFATRRRVETTAQENDVGGNGWARVGVTSPINPPTLLRQPAARSRSPRARTREIAEKAWHTHAVE